jgi:hypothetical protein
MSSALLEQARHYVDGLGWSVIPLMPRSKKPPEGFSWKPFQYRHPTVSELERWGKQYPEANIGVVGGAVSGLAIIDVDGPEGNESLKVAKLQVEQGPICLTPRPGSHIYFKHPGVYVTSSLSILPGLDIRADGAYAVAPSSIHPNGRRYEWLHAPDGRALPPFPEVMKLTVIRPDADFKNKLIPEGWRNFCLFRAACGFAKDTHARDFLFKRVMGLNIKRCESPLPEAEIKEICAHAWKYKFKGKQRMV